MPDPRVRRKARERAVQFLFSLAFTQYDWRDAIEGFWEMNPARPTIRQYAERLISGISESLPELDSAIASALENWSPERVGHVERAVLRVALFEMRYVDDVPVSVAINEAIEIVKLYGADDAPRFVNGVLDRLKKANVAETTD